MELFDDFERKKELIIIYCMGLGIYCNFLEKHSNSFKSIEMNTYQLQQHNYKNSYITTSSIP
jgi:hypothetical protein